MTDFNKRSNKMELLDRDDIPMEDIKRNMQELDSINKWLGGHRITIAGLKLLLGDKKTMQHHILEIGCGGGDNLRVIKKYCEANNIAAIYTGIDINPHCIAFARSRSENSGINFIASDYRTVVLNNKPTIIFSSLFCHHFSEEVLPGQIQWMQANSSVGFFINDLHRHPFAYYSIKWITRCLSASYLVKNDAPLSVLRSFLKKELMDICHKAGVHDAKIFWKWAFRWLLIFRHA